MELRILKNKRQKQIIFLLVCSIMIILSLTLKNHIDSMSKKYGELYIEFIETENGYEIGSTLEALTFIKDTNAEDIIYPIIDTSQIGERNFFYIAYDSEGNEKEFILKLNFIDPVPPVIELSQKEVEIIEGEQIDLESFVEKTYDPVDGDLPYSIEKPEDYSKIGVHEIKYICIDRNKNKTETILTVSVKEKVKEEQIPKTNQKEPELPLNTSQEPIDQNVQSSGNHAPKPSNKNYMFSDGYDMQTAPAACTSDLNIAHRDGYGGECIQITGSDGWPIGMQLNIY